MAWSQISFLQRETSQQRKYLERIYVTWSLFWLSSGTGMLNAISILFVLKMITRYVKKLNIIEVITICRIPSYVITQESLKVFKNT